MSKSQSLTPYLFVTTFIFISLFGYTHNSEAVNISGTSASPETNYSGYADSNGNTHGSWNTNPRSDGSSGGTSSSPPPPPPPPPPDCYVWFFPGDTYPSSRPPKTINIGESLSVSSNSSNNVNVWSHRGAGYAYVYLNGRLQARYYDTSRSFWGHVIPGSRFTTPGTYTVRATFTGRFGSYSCQRNVEVLGTPPSINFEVRNDTADTNWTTNDITINYSDQIHLKWDSDGVRCEGTNFVTNDSTNATQEEVTEPNPGSTRPYTLTCYSDDGGRATRVINVTRLNNQPTASIEVKNLTTDTAWTPANITIMPIDEIALRWNSNNATACSGSNFTVVGSDTSGDTLDEDVEEPRAGTNRVYSVVCTGPGGQGADSLQVTTEAGTGAEITCSDTVVRKGDEISCDWDVGTSDPSTCETQIGGGAITSPLTTFTGSFTYAVTAESVFSINCEDGVNKDSTTITILPEFQET